MIPSKLGFGTLTLSPLQKNMEVEEASELLYYAYEQGINFFDTAEIYLNYTQLKAFLQQVPRREVVIATKCYAHDKVTAQLSLDKALSGLGTDYIDFFLLHEQESVHTLRGHDQAIEYFLAKKREGLIRQFGISTHFVRGARAAIEDERITVLHPIINLNGIGIADGSRLEMEQAITEFHLSGRFIYAMKILGGGHLLKDYKAALNYALSLPVDAHVIGMQSSAEVDYNVRAFKGNIPEQAINSDRRLHIHDWCRRCGNCVRICQQKALHLDEHRAVVDPDRCTLCSYCVRVCPDFCIKVI